MILMKENGETKEGSEIWGMHLGEYLANQACDWILS